ncbi:MAG: PilW family protein [Thermoleophilia bacterium]
MSAATPYRRAQGERGITLIELVVAMTILTIVTTMIVMTWINLQNGYAFTISSEQARQTARDAMADMVAEIRDAQIPTSGPYAGQSPIIVASSYTISFYTSYDQPSGQIVLVSYSYRQNSSTGVWTLYRQVDTNGNNIIDSGDLCEAVSTYCVNQDPSGTGNLSDRADVFTYTYYDTSGNLQTTGATYTATGSLASGTTSVPAADLSNIVNVNINVISDVNPHHAPVYFDLQSTVQPRNLRQE